MAEWPRELLIDGKWQPASDGAVLEVINPASEEVIGTIARASDADITAALEAAERGFAAWRRSKPADKAAVLSETARLLRARTATIAAAITAEQGKPLAEAEAEVAQAAEQFDWYAGEALRRYGRVVEVDGEHQLRVERRPVGPVAAFTAWNFPLTLPARKVAPAIAAGCSIIVKPAEEAPSPALLLAQAVQEAGLPAGVLNVLTGDPAQISTGLLSASTIRKVSLTGSVPVGRELVGRSAAHLPSLSLELGGHAPVLVFADSDVEAAADMCVRAKFRNGGQVCISPSRFFVEEAVFARFTERFVERASALRVGPGTEPGIEVGPLANARRRDAVADVVEDVIRRGGTLRCGGKRPAHLDRGYFYEPTVITDVDTDSEVLRAEPFGPVAPILAFSSAEDAVSRANQLDYGLAGYVFTSTLRTAQRVADELEVGMIGVNEVALAHAAAPFGGVKLSGYGREGGIEGLEAYTTPVYVNVRP